MEFGKQSVQNTSEIIVEKIVLSTSEATQGIPGG